MLCYLCLFNLMLLVKTTETLPELIYLSLLNDGLFPLRSPQYEFGHGVPALWQPHWLHGE